MLITLIVGYQYSAEVSDLKMINPEQFNCDFFFLFFSFTADPNTLFRSNSLASKAMEQFMKVWQTIILFMQE